MLATSMTVTESVRISVPNGSPSQHRESVRVAHGRQRRAEDGHEQPGEYPEQVRRLRQASRESVAVPRERRACQQRRWKAKLAPRNDPTSEPTRKPAPETIATPTVLACAETAASTCPRCHRWAAASGPARPAPELLGELPASTSPILKQIDEQRTGEAVPRRLSVSRARNPRKQAPLAASQPHQACNETPVRQHPLTTPCGPSSTSTTSVVPCSTS